MSNNAMQQMLFAGMQQHQQGGAGANAGTGGIEGLNPNNGEQGDNSREFHIRIFSDFAFKSLSL